jgi:hypothetical protein
MVVSRNTHHGKIEDNREGCWWWHLMEDIHNNLMKWGGSLSNIPQIFKKLVIKTQYISDCLSIFKSTIYTDKLKNCIVVYSNNTFTSRVAIHNYYNNLMKWGGSQWTAITRMILSKIEIKLVGESDWLFINGTPRLMLVGSAKGTM